ncbi:uncharacterized protein P884DRAFT_192070 [Thermothelomyces heterothallicus CBS 202.75]|uniref:uncharacterized protein n=1 Tax=Thermothelomyces heterothallicus CBS 202.75 TaxID=1149848 RepID=UPI0037446939
MELHKGWNEHLRREAQKKLKPRIRCPDCGHGFLSRDAREGVDALFAAFEKHYSDSHVPLLLEKGEEADRSDFVKSRWENAKQSLSSERESGKAHSATQGVHPDANKRNASPPAAAAAAEGRKNKSPSPGFKRDGSRSRSVSPPKRKARAAAAAAAADDDDPADFERGAYKGKLWTPDDDTAAAPRARPDRSNIASHQRQRPSSGSGHKLHRQPHTLPARGPAAPPPDDDSAEIIKQPETRPISQEQLVAEVKGIYAGLVMVESKCIEVDSNQSSQSDPGKLNNDQWQALIALHRTLLHEHHDFFLASQHPSASPALRRLAAKYAMPARMWRHGIHSFLELLRHRLPASREHMLTFIYLAYSIMALLYETVPAFEDTWIECLGDLGRYRMAIEDDDIRDREIWTGVSRRWYSQASDKAPTTGRLYHHLAILARPNILQQLYYYEKSLCVEIPFPSTRESIMTLFEPTLSSAPNSQQKRLQPTEVFFVKTHAILFSGRQLEELDATMEAFLQVLNNHIARSTRRWLEPGYHMAISNICAVSGFGDESNPITMALKAFSRVNHKHPTDSQDQPMQDAAASETESTPSKPAAPNKQFPNALSLFTKTYDIVCHRFGDPNILPFLHVTLVFIYHLTFCPDAMVHVAPRFPWKLTAHILNTLLIEPATSSSISSTSPAQNVSESLVPLLEDDRFPGVEEVHSETGARDAKREETSGGIGVVRRKKPLADDYAMRGFPWTETYFPDGFFVTDERIDDDEKYLELPSMLEERRQRVVWLGCRIAGREGGKWLRFDKEAQRFDVNPTYDVELDLEMTSQMPATPGESVDFGELPDAVTVT